MDFIGHDGDSDDGVRMIDTLPYELLDEVVEAHEGELFRFV